MLTHTHLQPKKTPPGMRVADFVVVLHEGHIVEKLSENTVCYEFSSHTYSSFIYADSLGFWHQDLRP